ncbi:MAG: DNA/RNA non-specific endonuclease [Ruminococcus flavefaciens]|nr:DNA/RNA non-specific endonuclease [Ruminococcus flavefaciens]
MIGYQLLGKEIGQTNLIVGTRYMNIQGMQYFEDKIAECLEEGYHVLYRVTPFVEGNNKVATGVKMEAKSCEDDGKSLCFNVFCYNVQPGICINYENGDSREVNEWCRKMFTQDNVYGTDEEIGTQNYILNTYTRKFHKPDCNCVSQMNPAHRQPFNWSRQFLIDNHCKGCANCNA